MMVQEANFAYVSNIEGLDGYVLELPYGTQDRLAMLVVLPKRGFKLNDVANNLKTLGLRPILQRLAAFRKSDSKDNEVEVIMPKFMITTDFELTDILIQVGLTICIYPYIRDVLLILITSYRVDFCRIFV